MGDVRYTGNWNSVNAHTVPKWYDDCKFGIFIHWGIYSVPAFAPHTWELGEVDSKGLRIIRMQNGITIL